MSFSRYWAGLSAVIVLTGCATGRPLMPTPNLYVDTTESPFAEVPAPLQSNTVDVLYITDRVPERDENGDLRYGWGRSDSIAYGSVVVEIGEGLNWEEVVRASETQKRSPRVELTIRSITETHRGPGTPVPFKRVEGEIVEDPEYVAERERISQQFRQVLNRRLSLAPRKEVLLFVHGYDNTFEDAAFTLAESWHFLGRQHVPILYTWPAGYGGLFGYTYDRESSEFTVYHLKTVIRFLSTLPEVERINILAHSRGTDVLLTALRELFIAAWAAGEDPRRHYRIAKVVLAAPDLDVQVVKQRVAAEKFAAGIEKLTIYTSPKDKALGWAEKIFPSDRGRAGTFGIGEMTEQEKGFLADQKNTAIVEFDGEPTDRFGHSYFRTNPAVSSDFIIFMRDGASPGTAQRPLEHKGVVFWRIPPDYPNNPPSQHPIRE